MLHTLAQWDKTRRKAQVDFVLDYLLQMDLQQKDEPQMIIFGSRILQLCMFSYELQVRYQERTNLKTEFYHEGMHNLVHMDGIDIKSTKEFWKHSKTRNFSDIQKSYLKYVNSHETILPIRVLDAKKQSLDRCILLATVRKLGEGIDLSSLHTVCLLSSISANNLTQFAQVIGRLRPKQNVTKRILEFNDWKYKFFAIQCKKRKHFYLQQGLQIRDNHIP